MNKTASTYMAALTAVILALACVACSGSRHAVDTGQTGMSRELAAAGKNVESLGTRESASVAATVAKSYRPWQQVSLRGKARAEGLPIALNVKIYMEHGRLVIMSLNAPLLGEIGRVEMTGDSVLLVNKRGKTYCKEQTAAHLARFGASVADVQDLLLGRVFLLGYGTLSEGNAKQVEVSTGASDTWILTPKAQHPDAQYGFTLYPDGQMMMAAAFTPDKQYLATAEYEHSPSGYDIGLTIKAGKRSILLQLTLDKPDFEPVPLEPATINPKWTRMGFSQWIKSLM